MSASKLPVGVFDLAWKMSLEVFGHSPIAARCRMKGEEKRLLPYIMGRIPEVFPIYYYAVVKLVFWKCAVMPASYMSFGGFRSSHEDVFGGFWIKP